MSTEKKSFEDLPLSDPAFDALFKTPQVKSTDDGQREPTEDDSEDDA